MGEERPEPDGGVGGKWREYVLRRGQCAYETVDCPRGEGEEPLE
jgi:hypothetical protein